MTNSASRLLQTTNRSYKHVGHQFNQDFTKPRTSSMIAKKKTKIKNHSDINKTPSIRIAKHAITYIIESMQIIEHDLLHHKIPPLNIETALNNIESLTQPTCKRSKNIYDMTAQRALTTRNKTRTIRSQFVNRKSR